MRSDMALNAPFSFLDIILFEFKMSFVITSQYRRVIWMTVFDMNEVFFGIVGHVTTVLAHVHFGASFLVTKSELDPMYFATMRLQRTTLSKCFVTHLTFVRTDTLKKLI